MNSQTTSFTPITAPKPPEHITLYAPDGLAQAYAPVDAREILASGRGYTTEPPNAATGHHAPSITPAETGADEQSANSNSADDGKSGDNGNDKKITAAKAKKPRRK